MKNAAKIIACILFFGVVEVSFAQQVASTSPTTTKKTTKKQKNKSTKPVEDRIAVSDQVQPTEKGTKKQPAKKNKGISNK